MRRLFTRTLLGAMTLAPVADAQFPSQDLQHPSLGPNANLGADLDMHGVRLIVGAPGADEVLIYEYTAAAGWEVVETILNPNPSAWNTFGESVAIHSDRVVVGDRLGPSGFDIERGAAWVWQPGVSPDSYDVADYLIASDAAVHSMFGAEVAIRGDWTLVGAPQTGLSSPSDGGGAVYAYERRDSAPHYGPFEDRRLAPDTPLPGERFGAAIDMSQYRAVIGAPRATSVVESGRAFIYEDGVTGWRETAELVPPEEAIRFGAAVAMYADLVAVGAPGEGDFGEGAVYLYERSLAGWTLIRTLREPKATTGFGSSVELWEDRLVVGAGGRELYVYSRREMEDGERWFLSALVDKNAGDWQAFGLAVAMTGEHFAAGAPQADPGGTVSNGGRVYTYRYEEEFAAYCLAISGSCPCGNDDASAGCANSTGEGARLDTYGTSGLLLSNLRLQLHGLPPGAFTRVFVGHEPRRMPFGSGLLCTAVSVRRLPLKTATSQGTLAYGASEAIPADVMAGDVRYYQGWYRDAAAPCGPGMLFGTTNGVRVVFVP